MPTPPKTSRDGIIGAAREIIEKAGLDHLTMQAVASRVGVRAPSLYKHVANREELMRLVVADVVRELTGVLEGAVAGDDPRADLEALARTLREFAHRQPGSYRLVFASASHESRPDRELLVSAVAPMLRTTSRLVGPARALDAARLVTAWAHGFLTMELSGAFQMGGDLDDAFAYGIDRLGVAFASPPDPAER